MPRPKVTVKPVGPRDRWHAVCEEPDCGWRHAPDEKTYVQQRAAAHRRDHREGLFSGDFRG